MSVPPTLVFVHRTENPRKCSARPLKTRDDFRFINWPRDPERLVLPDVSNYVRLSLDGPMLSPDDAASGLLVLDGTWRRVAPMERAVAHVPGRSLPRLFTAYPRRSKIFEDPDAGLATVEAIYAAYRLTGRDPSGLLDHYRWADEFLARNAAVLDAVTGARETSS